MRSFIYAECRKLAFYTECSYAECRYAECRGTLLAPFQADKKWLL